MTKTFVASGLTATARAASKECSGPSERRAQAAAPVVASCGTALTAQQAQLLRRFTSKVVLSFDPDGGGFGAAPVVLAIVVGVDLQANDVAF